MCECNGGDESEKIMKITVKNAGPRQIQLPKGSVNCSPTSDLSSKLDFARKPPRRKGRACGVGGVLRREAGARHLKRNGRPETPLLGWKFGEGNEEGDSLQDKLSPKALAKTGWRAREAVSARKLAAGVWRMYLPPSRDNGGQKLELQSEAAHVRDPKHGHLMEKVAASLGKNLVHSPLSISGPKNGHFSQFEPTFQYSNSAMEGVTKWDPVGWKASDELTQMLGRSKHLDLQASSVAVISALETELEQARARINDLESEHRSSKKKLEQFLRKLSEERAAWRSREHEKIRAIIDDMKADLSREKKNRQRLEMINSKLISELSNVKLLAKRYKQEYEKERKAKDLVEDVCDELAKEIGEDRAELDAVKKESMKLQEEVEEDRKMLQMAEVWREERVQMKLVDAKLMLEEKYSQMNNLVAELESFLNPRCTSLDKEEKKKAEFLLQAVNSINIQDIRELTYEAPNPDDFLSIFDEVNFGESSREAEACVGYSPASHAPKNHRLSPKVKLLDKDNTHVRSNVAMDQSGELEEEDSEWETASHAEDHGSSYSPEGSDISMNKNFRGSNSSRNGTEWEINRGRELEISEACQVPTRNAKKASSISKLWRSCPSQVDNCNILPADGMNGRLSNGVIISPDQVYGRSELSPDLAGQWSSPDAGKPQAARGMKGCIEWPCNAQKSSLKAQLLEARMESQKTQLRQVLKQKI